jgi:SET domain-containing protein
VGFFASRDIQVGEEMCIDYSPGRHGDQLQRVIQCFCGLAKCKGWLF